MREIQFTCTAFATVTVTVIVTAIVIVIAVIIAIYYYYSSSSSSSSSSSFFLINPKSLNITATATAAVATATAAATAAATATATATTTTTLITTKYYYYHHYHHSYLLPTHFRAFHFLSSSSNNQEINHLFLLLLLVCYSCYNITITIITVTIILFLITLASHTINQSAINQSAPHRDNHTAKATNHPIPSTPLLPSIIYPSNNSTTSYLTKQKPFKTLQRQRDSTNAFHQRQEKKVKAFLRNSFDLIRLDLTFYTPGPSKRDNRLNDPSILNTKRLHNILPYLRNQPTLIWIFGSCSSLTSQFPLRYAFVRSYHISLPPSPSFPPFHISPSGISISIRGIQERKERKAKKRKKRKRKKRDTIVYLHPIQSTIVKGSFHPSPIRFLSILNDKRKLKIAIFDKPLPPQVE
ncbi:hypothetical protein EYC80_003471 [Monilinia laxa]|uniref:Uncharacterized protein n=1 Tax=Monilinia laxa TaxID=61186 RepID=A0A5N6KDS5_MONLA|nr:hypothetical protein EYC80_003471 [Monilinia laxa]